jgi:hypothetical protein
MDVDSQIKIMNNKIMQNQRNIQIKAGGFKKKEMCSACKRKKQEKEKAQARERNLMRSEMDYKTLI